MIGTLSAAELLRSVGLMADGPVVWGRPVPARGSGVFVVELVAPLRAAPLELTRIGKWLERVPELRLDGVPPTSRALAARLGAFWIPSARVVFVGSTDGSIGGRIEAIRNTVLGERRPHPGGHWLHALRGLETARIWWAPTNAIEEYEDAVLTSFAESVPAEERAALPDQAVVLPWANLRTATGERKATGLSNSLQPGDPVRREPPRRVTELPPGAAEGAGGFPPSRAAGGTVRRAPRPADPSGARPVRAAASRPSKAAPPAAEPTWISADGLERIRDEHRELTEQRRPEVIARIKAAKELGDLKENADYTAAREEQSFLEGRIAQLEATLRTATVITTGADAEGRVTLGSTVTIEDDAGGRMTFRVVGSAEADPGAGRISNVSPVGRALLGRSSGEVVDIVAPRGTVRYRIIEVAAG
ncbi:MAG: transcription elongation factor GreA [Chloroflexota bacterium]